MNERQSRDQEQFPGQSDLIQTLAGCPSNPAGQTERAAISSRYVQKPRSYGEAGLAHDEGARKESVYPTRNRVWPPDLAFRGAANGLIWRSLAFDVRAATYPYLAHHAFYFSVGWVFDR